MSPGNQGVFQLLKRGEILEEFWRFALHTQTAASKKQGLSKS